MKYIIANWKAHKTYGEIESWMTTFSDKLKSNSHIIELLEKNILHIIICPSFPYLHLVKTMLPSLPNISVGSQDVSSLENGKHTGEVTAEMLKDFVEFAIIGHSERRTQFNESNDMLSLKVQAALNAQIQPILCVRNSEDIIADTVKFVAYEPVDAIGTGHNKSTSEVLTKKIELGISQDQIFIYGGSVTAEDCKNYLLSKEIDGFLVGTDSLEVDKFLGIIKQVECDCNQ